MSSVKHDYFSSGEPEIDRFDAIVAAFENNSEAISDIKNTTGSGGNEVLSAICSELEEIGFSIEKSKKSKHQIPLTVPSADGQTSKYHVDGHHPEWEFILEVEGGRRDAIYKDIVKGLLLHEASTLVLAVPSRYEYGEQTQQSDDRYSLARREAAAIHHTERFESPCDILIIGY